MTIDEAYKQYTRAKGYLGTIATLATVRDLKAVVTFSFEHKNTPMETDAAPVLKAVKEYWEGKLEEAKNALKEAE